MRNRCCSPHPLNSRTVAPAPRVVGSAGPRRPCPLCVVGLEEDNGFSWPWVCFCVKQDAFSGRAVLPGVGPQGMQSVWRPAPAYWVPVDSPSPHAFARPGPVLPAAGNGSPASNAAGLSPSTGQRSRHGASRRDDAGRAPGDLVRCASSCGDFRVAWVVEPAGSPLPAPRGDS
ncbi:hypothetical protein P7K49_000634 [Saguinus oedipus]|uniref:Uncharacterized protein n=1 Tax=Saguinus oedipus TaxID=9490 RepID=A0ABQ9WC70_SAGOE|nr:hypothetical protein P7K49_000634 [Saguinus oedipus]